MTARKGSALRSVGADEAPAKRKSVAEAASSGTHLELLVAMRDRLARAISDEGCPPRDLAALTRRLSDVAGEIKTLREAADDDHDGSEADDSFDASAI